MADGGKGEVWDWDEVGGRIAEATKEFKLAGGSETSMVLGDGCGGSGISGRPTTASTKRRSNDLP